MDNKHVVLPVQPLGAECIRTVEIVDTKTRIRDVSIERPDVVAYLQGVSPDKREIALVHAIEVGITEIVSRRRRAPH